MQPSIRPLTVDDIPSALSLCHSAGWNQLREDWARLIEYECDGCFAAEISSRLIATVTTTRYGTELAWIGMMLVDSNFRRHGVGTALMKTSLDYLRGQGIGCVKLDATPLGQKVYRRLGFSAESNFQRWECRNVVRESNAIHNELDETSFALDRRAFGVDRARWLRRLADDSHVYITDEGFGMLRPGELADYLGPVVAISPPAARTITERLLRSGKSDRVFWDAMNADAVNIAKSLGFQPVRELTRMWFGHNTIRPDMALQYAISDPGTG